MNQQEIDKLVAEIKDKAKKEGTKTLFYMSRSFKKFSAEIADIMKKMVSDYSKYTAGTLNEAQYVEITETRKRAITQYIKGGIEDDVNTILYYFGKFVEMVGPILMKIVTGVLQTELNKRGFKF